MTGLAPLSVDGAVVLDSRHGRAELVGTGDSVVLRAVSFRQLRDLATAIAPVARGRRQRLGRAARGLAIAGLSARVELRGRPVVELGRAARGGFIARRLGWRHVEIRPGAWLRAVVDAFAAARQRV